jgi:DNA-binding transcriptional ArsR family regulator
LASHDVFRAIADPTRRAILDRLRHTGLTSREIGANTAVGWETSFGKLAEILAQR